MQKYLKKIAFISLIIFFLPVCATKKKDDSLQTLILLFLLQSISRSSSSAGTSTGTGTGTTGSVTVTGKVTYEFPTYSAANGLNLGSPTLTSKIARQVQVQILDSSSNVLASGNTDNTGTYTITLTTSQTQILVRANARVMANTLNTNYASSDTTNNILVNVLDNTSSSANWSVVSSSVAVTSSITQNLTATHSSRAAGAFAILGTEMDAYDLLKSAESGVTYNKLNIYWSPNNSNSSTTTSCPITSGCIGTSYYTSSSKSLYILGKLNSDSDEYDSGVMAHEFGHYVEDTLFRSDSIGGQHGGDNRLDPRLAFGEGFGNAFGSIVRGNSLYYDTAGTNNTSIAVSMDMETGTTTNPGVFSETSVQKIIWDLYDSASDGETVSLGFTPLYTVLRNDQKNTTAFTTLLPFINGLKTRNNSVSAAIDTLVALESVASITGDFVIATEPSTASSTPGNCRSAIYLTNSVASYTDTSGTLQADFGGSGSNKYCATRYYRMSTTGFKTFTLAPQAACDLDMYLYDKGVIKKTANAGAESATETFTYTLAGTEVLDIRFYSKSGSSTAGSCTFTLTIN